jgi:hypothetical protein
MYIHYHAYIFAGEKRETARSPPLWQMVFKAALGVKCSSGSKLSSAEMPFYILGN